MRSIESNFYRSAAWKKCRKSYLELHPFCECCMARGVYTPAKHVHHIKWLDESNFKDASVSLNFDNLKALCVPCHNRTHAGTENVKRRYKVLEDGSIDIFNDETSFEKHC